MEYSFAPGADGPELGLHRAGRWDEVLEHRALPPHDRARKRDPQHVREWAREERLPAYDQSSGEGYLRHLIVREGRNTGQALVQLVTHERERFDRERLIEVLTAFPEVRSIHWTVNDTPAEVTNLPTELLWGEEAIEEELGGLRFRIRPNAFLQTNTRMAERLYELARAEAGLTGGETVYDLYCGIGTIGLSLARDALTVWGIEISEESVACAIENAELNAIGNAAFYAGNVGQVLRELRDRAGEPDVVVVDPPRAGLAGKALKRLGELAAPRVVYVSCNPTTLAGDTKRLVEEYGYRLVRTTPVDMFPHTPHVESVSLLDARAGSARRRGPRPSRRQSRSPFASRKPSAIAGSAGRPPSPRTSSASIVIPSPAIIAATSGTGRSPKRALAARKTEKKSTSGKPSRAAFPPGTTNAIESFVNTAGWLLGDLLRRPVPDRVGVDPRDHERDEHHPRERLERPEEEPAGERDRAELGEVREHGRVGAPKTSAPRRGRPRPPSDDRAVVAQRQREPRRARTSPASARARRARRSTSRERVEMRRRLEPRDERREEDQ